MKTLFAFLLLTTGAFCQQNAIFPYPEYPDTAMAPVHDIRDFNLDVIAMATSLSPHSYRHRSYGQWLQDQQPKLIVPPVTPNPIKIRDNQGRITGTIQQRSNGLVTVRDARGRVTHTATVRGNSITVKKGK
jgi:hypothetical protein